MLFCSEEPCNLESSVQKWLRNFLSLSDTIVAGNPWSLTTSLMKASASDLAVRVLQWDEMLIFTEPIHHN